MGRSAVSHSLRSFSLRCLALLGPSLLLGLTACAPSAPRPPLGAAPFHLAALGDSFASGQGAPNQNFSWWKPFWTPSWDDKRCNRSNHSPTAMAVQQLVKQGYDVTLEPEAALACSGASIERGLLGPYNGPEPPPGAAPLPAQVDALKSLLSRSPATHVGAVTLSAGGNDILFEYIVLMCIVSQDCSLSRPLIELRLGELPAALDALADALASTAIPANRIFVLEYPDPTRDSDDSYCDHEPVGDALGGISRENAEWASSYVLPRLNSALCEAAKRNGWNYVDRIATRFDQHGWCAKDNWINTVNESLSHQRHFRGGMHPDPEGYTAIGERLAAALKPLIDGQTPPPVTSCPPVPQG